MFVKFISRLAIYTISTSRTLLTLVTLVTLRSLNGAEVFGHSVSIGDNEVTIGSYLGIRNTDTVCTVLAFDVSKRNNLTIRELHREFAFRSKSNFGDAYTLNTLFTLLTLIALGTSVTFIAFSSLDITKVELFTIRKSND